MATTQMKLIHIHKHRGIYIHATILAESMYDVNMVQIHLIHTLV